jgi:hypothetical protein
MALQIPHLPLGRPTPTLGRSAAQPIPYVYSGEPLRASEVRCSPSVKPMARDPTIVGPANLHKVVQRMHLCVLRNRAFSRV